MFCTIMGVGYYWLFFARINAAAYLFAGLFLGAALVFLVEGAIRNRIHFQMLWDVRGWSPRRRRAGLQRLLIPACRAGSQNPLAYQCR